VLKKNVSTEWYGCSKPQICSERRKQCINSEKYRYSNTPRWWVCFINTFRYMKKWLHFTNMCDRWRRQFYCINSDSLKVLCWKRLQKYAPVHSMPNCSHVMCACPFHALLFLEPLDGFSSALIWEGFSAILWSVPVLITIRHKVIDTLPVNSFSAARTSRINCPHLAEYVMLQRWLRINEAGVSVSVTFQ
jgi:hypothetical protein